MEICTDILKAAMLCASVDKIRYYLNGVYVDPTGHIVATDGHRMFVAKIDVSGMGAFDGFIIPSAVLKRVLTGNKATSIDVTASVIDRVSYEPVDGTYPDWRRVVPSELSGEVAQYNAAYIGDMGKIAKLLGAGNCPVIGRNGDGPAGVTFSGRTDCLAVLMPLRPGVSAVSWDEARGIL